MKNRLKAVRKSLGLNQSEFGARIGVTNPAISKLEKGERNFTDQMILAICREFGVSEKWLRTGEGEMFVISENALIMNLSEQYGLDALDRRILEIYVSLPESHRRVLKGFASKLAEAAAAPGAIADPEPPAEEEYRAEWNNGLTEEEAVTLVRQRYSDAKKGDASSSTYGKAGQE